jgi:co-chaperonin GroES (HSP10)
MKAFLYNAIEVDEVRPLHDYIIVTEMNFDEQVTQSGIVLRSDDMKFHGVKPRWARVYAIGDKQKDVSVGDWVLVSHGRWTRGVLIRDDTGTEHVIRRVDNKDILLVSAEQPTEEMIGSG